jgi:mRNA interferase RelE/StbE
MYSYLFDPAALKDLKKFPDYIQVVILQKLEYFITSDEPLFFAKKLKHSELGSYRFRIGDYRAIFDIRGNTIIILRIGHRREIYK